MSTMVQVSHLYKDFYTKEGETKVLTDINFTVEQGKILALLGPSGSGKSTILNIIANLIEPTDGDVQTFGKIGYMFQNDLLFEWRSIMDNITLGLEIQNQLTDKAEAEIERLLKIYDLWDYRNYYPHELSGGMRQRVALIRTLVMNPDIILLDEPFSGLDAQTRMIVTDDIYKIIKQQGKTAILVTHDIDEAISMADYVAILSKRPTTINKVYPITLSLDVPKTPLSARGATEFKEYFNTFWKELGLDEEATWTH